MEINLSNFGNMGVRPETFSSNVVDAKQNVHDAANVARTASNLTIGEGASCLASAEPVADVPEAALAHDDDLGKLMEKAFNLPPPPMPVFTD